MLPEVHVIVQMRVAEQYFSVVLFIIVYKMVLTFESVDEIFKCELTIQMKATEWQFPVVLFTMPHKVDSSVESGDDHLTAAWLAQLEERRSAEREIVVQTPEGPTLRIFK